MERQAHEQDKESNEGPAQIASLEDALLQLNAIAAKLIHEHRELEEEGQAIQAEMDGLHQLQESRAQQIAARLQNAGASILAFTDGGQADQVEMIEDDRAYAHE